MISKRAVPVLLVAVFAALAAAAVPAQERRLEPVDEAARDPSWRSFRNELLNAVDARDRSYVMSILAKDVRTNLGAPRGPSEFRKQWDIDSAGSPLWRALRSALFLGAAYVTRENGQRELCAPYLLAKWPKDVDPFAHGAVIAREVLVKAEPSSNSATLQVVGYDIVKVADWEIADNARNIPQRWVRITVKNGEGYVPEEQIRSPIEHAACFVKSDGRWRMTGLAPGGG